MVHQLKTVLSVLLIGLCLPGMVACSKASEDECDQAYERLIELRTDGQPAEVQKVKRSQLEKDRPRFLETCVGKVKPEVIRCWLDAEREEELARCD